MKNKPWIAIDLMTNEVLGNYRSEAEAYGSNMGKPIMVQYAPRAREVKK